MNSEESYRWRKQVVWGLIMILVGAVFLADRLGYMEAETLWHYWPLLLVLIGINQTIGYPTPREFGNGLWLVFIGLWLFAVFENLFGLTFRNSWPLFILVAGIKMVLDPFIARRLANHNPENRHEK
ncbi:hypothetical protein B0920_08670 [Massilia sp. KIM]|uniref:LiaI-LiaF-like domain-containing protein n=1 Tax=Massilia sp. KIM TaxID=1955422 RepID=UPI00098F1415|nr:DUF5668 domain-containing protein [Massilia sp. KIM]OON63431.1 hypothetical protein B0920_08670 [Massilia sp. KIM]